MNRIGVVGVGEIARAIVTGLCSGEDEAPDVHLSPRGAAASAELAAAYPSVRVCADNQSVVDGADLVIVAVRRQVRAEALGGLRVGADKVVVNLMAGVANAELRDLLGTDAAIVRAIPLPTVRERRSVTVTYPSHPLVDGFFERLGGALPVADEAAFDVFSALTGTLSAHYAYLAALTEWAARQGIPAADAERYVRGLFEGVGRSLGDVRGLDRLAADHETPGGNNERVRTGWFTAGNAAALGATLDGLLKALRG